MTNLPNATGMSAEGRGKLKNFGPPNKTKRVSVDEISAPIILPEATMSTSELKACPFCGGEARIRSYRRSVTICDFWMKCSGCALEFPVRHSSAVLAAVAWNTRVADSSDARVRELETALEWIEKRCPLLPLQRAHDENHPGTVHIEMAYDAGQLARAALKGAAK